MRRPAIPGLLDTSYVPAAVVSQSVELYAWDNFTAGSGLGYTLTHPPAAVDRIEVFLTGMRIGRAVTPAPNQFSLGGVTNQALGLGLSKQAGESLIAIYPYISTDAPMVYDDLSGAASSSFTLSEVPHAAGEVDVYLTGSRLRQVPSAPGYTEFSLVGQAGTLGFVRAADDLLQARYPRVRPPAWAWDDFTGVSSAAFTLSQMPRDADEVDVFLTGFRLMRYTGGGAPGPAEFTLSGQAGTLGLVRGVTDSLIVRYPRA